jgi:uncharacterized membrane protein YbhN (UPF0104 family)
MSKSRFQQYYLVLFLLAGLSFLAVFFYNQATSLDHTLSINENGILVVVAFQLLFWWIAVLNWRLVLYSTTEVNVSTIVGLGHILLTTIGKYIPGKIWGMLARGLLLRKAGLSVEHAATAIYYELVLNVYAAIIVASIAACVLFPGAYSLSVAALSLAGAVLLPRTHDLAVRVMRPLFRRLRYEFRPKALTRVGGIRYVQILLASSATWITSGFVLTGLLFTVFDRAPTIEIFTVVLFANTVGITTGFLALFAPGGLGVREVATSSILSTIMPLSEAIALTIIFRLWVMAWEFMGGVVAFRVLRAGFQGDPESRLADSADAKEQ